MTAPMRPSKVVRRRQHLLAAVGLVGLAGSVLFAFAGPTAFFDGYLLAWVWWAGPALGCAAWLMIHHLSGGAWGWAIRRSLTTGAAMSAVAAVLVVPALAGAGKLMPWWPAYGPDPGALVHFKSTYLTAGGFAARAVAYVTIWVGGAALLWRASRDGRSYAPRLAAAGLLIYAVTATFAFIDWVGSLEAEWYSSVYGLYTIVGHAVSGLALVILVNVLGGRFRDADAQTLNDVGNLLLASVVMWAYLAFSQFFIVWNGDLPHQSAWYVRRSEGVWSVLGVVLILLHFVLPFGALLFRGVKRNPRVLAGIASVVLVAHGVDVAWMVGPALPDAGGLAALQACVIAVALGALLGAAAMWVWARTERDQAVPAPTGKEQDG